MITEVAGRILAEFERNLSVMLTQGLAARRSSLAGDERPGGAAADAGGASPREATAPGFDAGHGSPQAQACCSRRRRCWPRPRRCWRRSSPGDRQPAGARAQAVRRTEHAQHRPAGRLGADRIWNFPAVWQGAMSRRAMDAVGISRDASVATAGAAPRRCAGRAPASARPAVARRLRTIRPAAGCTAISRARHGVAGLECRRSATHDAPGTFRPAAVPGRIAIGRHQAEPAVEVGGVTAEHLLEQVAGITLQRVEDPQQRVGARARCFLGGAKEACGWTWLAGAGDATWPV